MRPTSEKSPSQNTMLYVNCKFIQQLSFVNMERNLKFGKKKKNLSSSFPSPVKKKKKTLEGTG